MKKQILIIIILFLTIYSYSQNVAEKGYTGNQVGNGAGLGPGRNPYFLEGRKAIKKPIPQTKKCNESGRVVMDIVVNKKGKVIEAKIGRGSTTKALCLVEASKKAALKTKWNKDKNAKEKQEGKIMYFFNYD
jgi:hypothetical protein